MTQKTPKSMSKTAPSEGEEEFDSEDQSWFWTPEWQAGEEAASREIADGELSPTFDKMDDAKEWLNSDE